MGVQKRFTNKEIELIVNSVREGVAVSWLAYRMKRRADSIYQLLRRYGVSPKVYRDRRIIQLYARGHSMKYIARELSIGYNTVKRTLEKNGHHLESASYNPKRLSVQVREEIFRSFWQGKSVYNISSDLGVSARIISRLIIPRRMDVIKEMRSNGYTCREIAKVVFCSPSTVLRDLQKMGIK